MSLAERFLPQRIRQMFTRPLKRYQPLMSWDEMSKIKAFVILDGDKQYTIWPDGRVEGFDHSVFIMNGIPCITLAMEARHVMRMQERNK